MTATANPALPGGFSLAAHGFVRGLCLVVCFVVW